MTDRQAAEAAQPAPLDPDPAIGMRIAKCPHCGEGLSIWPEPASDGPRCVKCGGTDISTRWDRDWTDCTWSSRRDPGNMNEHLHRHCRNCAYGWGEPVAALREGETP